VPQDAANLRFSNRAFFVALAAAFVDKGRNVFSVRNLNDPGILDKNKSPLIPPKTRRKKVLHITKIAYYNRGSSTVI